MVFAFGHLVGAWVVGKGYELFKKQSLPCLAWFFLLLGGILPDADFLLDWLFDLSVHRTFTHSFSFALFAGLLVYFIFYKNEHRAIFTLALSSGILVHLFLDVIVSPVGLPLFWPSNLYFSFFSIDTLKNVSSSLYSTTLEELVFTVKFAVLDMVIGVAWVFYLLLTKRLNP